MIIKSLKLVNFRNYSLSNFTFDRGINFIYGDNAIGKTNLVEGIYYFSLTRSFRTNTESLLINKNASSFYLEGVFIKENKKYNINISLTSNVKKIGVNGRNIKKVSDLSKIVNVISFIPSDVNLLKDTPKKRRDFLNTTILKNNPNYLKLLNDYEYLIKERNSLLKSESLDFNLINIINFKLASISYEIYKIRDKFINKIRESVEALYKEIFNKDINVKVDYLTFNTSSDYVNKCLKIYEENMDNDLKLGYTSTGIQKDDFCLKIDGKDIGKFGSQGENRIASLILKLSIYELSEINNKPILILDDILSELDKNNESLLLKYLNKVEQVFITSTKKYDIENCHYCYLTK